MWRLLSGSCSELPRIVGNLNRRGEGLAEAGPSHIENGFAIMPYACLVRLVPPVSQNWNQIVKELDDLRLFQELLSAADKPGSRKSL